MEQSIYVTKRATPEEYPMIGLFKSYDIKESNPTKEVDLDFLSKSVTSSLSKNPNSYYFFVNKESSPDIKLAGGGMGLVLDPFYGFRSELQLFFVLKDGRRKGLASRIMSEMKNVLKDREVGVLNVNIENNNVPS